MHCSVFLREIDDNGPTRYVIAVADVLLPSPVTNLRRCYANEQDLTRVQPDPPVRDFYLARVGGGGPVR
jgi:hypothetical protein